MLAPSFSRGVMQNDPAVVRSHPRAAVDLIARQATDVTTTFLTTDHRTRTLRALEARAGRRTEDARGTIRYVATRLRFTDAQQDTILDHCLGAGQRAAGGILRAVTSAGRATEPGGVA